MATYLFPAGKHARSSSSAPHKPFAIPRHLFNIVRGANDAIDALQLFLKLLRENDFDINSPGYMAFDAHVGDTACQLRACMLLEIFNRYRQHVSSTTEVCFIEQTIKHLKKVVDNAQSFCKEVCDIGMSKNGPAALGISKQGMSINEILRKIGWTEPRKSGRTQEVSNPAVIVSVASSVTSPPISQASASRISVGSTNTSASGAASISQIDPFDLEEEQTRVPSIVYAQATSDYWEPWDWHQVVHFLVYSYVLSKYKNFTIRAHVYGANISPQSAFDCSNQLLDGNFPHPCQPPTKKPIELEFATLQSYLSDCSCAWLSSTARVFSPDRQLMTRYVEPRMLI